MSSEQQETINVGLVLLSEKELVCVIAAVDMIIQATNTVSWEHEMYLKRARTKLYKTYRDLNGTV